MKDGVSEITEELIDKTPDVQEHVVKTEQEKIPETDKSGSVFDERIHRTKDGKPLLTKKGMFAKKTGKAALKLAEIEKQTEEQKLEQEQIQSQQQIAKILTHTFLNANQMLLGSDFKPLPDEVELWQNAFAIYVEANQIDSVPPWATLFMTALIYYGRRVTMEKTQGKIKRAANWIRKQFKKGKHGTFSDHRANGIRKDDFSEKTLQQD